MVTSFAKWNIPAGASGTKESNLKFIVSTLMNYKNFQIRNADNRDIIAIKAIIFSVLREYSLVPSETGKDKDLEDIESSYIYGNGYFGVVIDTDANTMVGTIGLYPMDSNTCELRKMYLLPHARGRGLGSFLLTTAIQIAKEKGYKTIVLETVSPLVEAISLYRKFGFTEITPREINDRVDQAFMLQIG